jgi:hypothetical protein
VRRLSGGVVRRRGVRFVFGYVIVSPKVLTPDDKTSKVMFSPSAI